MVIFRARPPILILATALALAACGQKSAPPSPQELSTLKPDDAHLAALYDSSCKACHANPGSGAPLVHDHAAWEPRWSKGLPTLVDHAVVGFEAMPAGGQCSACTKSDYEKLIRFMADEEGSP
jgi:cytochrome c5